MTAPGAGGAQRCVVEGPWAYKYDRCGCGGMKWRAAKSCRPCHDRRPRADIAERLNAKWTKNGVDQCHHWTAAKNRDGYGIFHVGTEPRLAHRVAYELARGPIPGGLVLDHLCRNVGCVNPLHLEPVTDQVNILRGLAPAAVNARKTHCKRGHLLDGENLRVTGGKRYCRVCKRLRESKGPL